VTRPRRGGEFGQRSGDDQRRGGLNGPLVVGLCTAAIPLATRRVADSDRRTYEIVSSNTRDSQAEARTLKELLDDVR